MKLSLLSIEKEGYVRIGADGNITGMDLPADGTNPLQGVLGANWAGNRVLLGMDKTTYIDSAAIGWLIATHKECQKQGGKLVVHSLAPNVRRMLDLLKIGKLVALANDEAEGRQMLLADAAPAPAVAGGTK